MAEGIATDGEVSTTTEVLSRPAARLSRARRPAIFLAALVVLLASSQLLGSFSLIIVTQAFLYAMVVIGVDLLWGYTGILSFGQSAFFALGAYSLALLYAHVGYSTETTIVAVAGGVISSAVVAAGIGWVAFWNRASPFFIAVVTFALPAVLVQALLAGGRFTGGSTGLVGFNTPDLTLIDWYLTAGFLLLIVTTAAYVLVKSDAGKVLMAIRENEYRCRFLGLRTTLIKTAILVTCSVVASIAGLLFTASFAVVTPDLASFLLGTQFVIWVALGGRGTLFGPILATVCINVVIALLSGSLPYVWLLIIGLLFVVVVVRLPGGIASLVMTTWRLVVGRLARTFFTGTLRKPQSQMTVREVPAFHGRAGDGEAPPALDVPPALNVRGLSKHFGSLSALKEVNFSVGRGELVSVIGPNGAGKTTLLRCISDGRERSAGSVWINGRPIGKKPPQATVAMGVGHKFQTPIMFDALTVFDSLRVARSLRQRPSLTKSSACVGLPQAALRIAEVTGLIEVLAEPVSNLSHGMKQALELAMVLALEPSVVLLDEPTAGLTEHERRVTGEVLSELVHSERISIVLVEHDIDFVREISSRIIVLHMGERVFEGSVSEVVKSDLVRDIYSGRAWT